MIAVFLPLVLAAPPVVPPGPLDVEFVEPGRNVRDIPFGFDKANAVILAIRMTDRDGNAYTLYERRDRAAFVRGAPAPGLIPHPGDVIEAPGWDLAALEGDATEEEVRFIGVVADALGPKAIEAAMITDRRINVRAQFTRITATVKPIPGRPSSPQIELTVKPNFLNVMLSKTELDLFRADLNKFVEVHEQKMRIGAVLIDKGIEEVRASSTVVLSSDGKLGKIFYKFELMPRSAERIEFCVNEWVKSSKRSAQRLNASFNAFARAADAANLPPVAIGDLAAIGKLSLSGGLDWTVLARAEHAKNTVDSFLFGVQAANLNRARGAWNECAAHLNQIQIKQFIIGYLQLLARCKLTIEFAVVDDKKMVL